MILNKLYRLKRKKGAVLFVVIAMMTLLVIMATAAYYTARNSHQTVISNYDFSQLYLSAISVSDMMIGAVTNDTVDNTSSRNNFKDLKEAVTSTSFTVGKKITAKSNNISSEMTTAEKIMAGTANNPVENGVLDAVQVVIEHESSKVIAQTKNKKTYMDYYLFTTTAYYRNNVITIQDRVGREWQKSTDGDLFDTFFTATGKELPGDEAVENPERCVVINAKEISDDAFFENTYTIFKDISGGNQFLGGLTSSGNVWIEQFNGAIPEATSTSRNDWFIGGSLIMGGNGQNWDIKNNNLVVNGDLILTTNMNTFQAANIYVNGNIIDLSGSANSNIGADVYVAGTVITDLNVYETDSDSLKAAKENALKTLKDTNNEYQNTIERGTGTRPGNLAGYGSMGSSSSGFNPGTHQFCVNNQTDISSAVASKVTGTWNPASVTLPIEPYMVYDEEKGIAEKIDSTSIDGAVAMTEPNPYNTYSVSDETMANTLTIDFGSLTRQKDSAGKDTDIYKGEFFVNGVSSGPKATVTVNSSGNGSATVDLPYCTNGYVLDLKFTGGTSVNHRAITYTIDSGTSNESVLPIVLKANFDDKSGQTPDANLNNAFAWNVDSSGNRIDGDSGQPCKVKVTGKGDVFFELGNYESHGEYKKFTPGKSLNTATFWTTEAMQMGNEKQVDAVSPGNQSPDPLKALLKSGTSDLQDNYDNQIMIISNKNGGVAFNNNRKNTLLCGYIYAPFSDYSNWQANGGSAPALGGMIVSNYSVELSYFVFAEPDPQLIENLEAALPTVSDTSGDKPDKWYVSDASKGLGTNFIG